MPISFAYADDGIYGYAAAGRKIELMRQSRKVAVLVDDIKNIATWRSVLVRGTWHELYEDSARVRCRALLLRAFDGDLWWATARHGHRTTLADAILYRINIDEMTGMAQNQ